jgi:hypothetical protein
VSVLGALCLPAAASSASTTPVLHMPLSWHWRPGAPLPRVPAGYKLMAMPSQATLANLKPGQSAPETAISAASYRANATQYQRLENPAGLVNLEAVYSPLDCLPTSLSFVSDIHSEVASVAQSYSTISGMTQSFTYAVGQTTNIELGISETGDYGSWTGTGNTGWSTTDSPGSQQDFTNQTGVNFVHWRTYFEWGKFKQNDTCASDVYYQTQPYQWNAGTAYVHPSGASGASYCEPESSGAKFHKNSATASTL